MKTNQFKLLFDKKVNVEEKPFVSTFSESCFRITVTVSNKHPLILLVTYFYRNVSFRLLKI